MTRDGGEARPPAQRRVLAPRPSADSRVCRVAGCNRWPFDVPTLRRLAMAAIQQLATCLRNTGSGRHLFNQSHPAPRQNPDCTRLETASVCTHGSHEPCAPRNDANHFCCVCRRPPLLAGCVHNQRQLDPRSSAACEWRGRVNSSRRFTALANDRRRKGQRQKASCARSRVIEKPPREKLPSVACES